MFLNKWTIQVAKQGQNEEVSFASKDQALRYADKLIGADQSGSPASLTLPVSLILIDPNNNATLIGEHEPK